MSTVTTAPDLIRVDLPITEVHPAADNPRRDLGDVAGLAKSIATTGGLLQPILVTPRPADEGGPYLVVIGHRRLAACQRLDLATISAFIREMDDDERLTLMYVENAQREDLTPMEEAQALKSLIDLGHSQRAVAEKVGKSQAHVSKRLALLGLPDEVQALVDKGRIIVGDAVELARLRDEKQIRAVLTRTQRTDGDSTYYVDVARVVGTVLAVEKREKQIKQVARALSAEGVEVIDYPSSGFIGTTRRLGDAPGQVNVNADEHAGEPCHAAAINADAEVVYVCTDPARHGGATGAGESGDDDGENDTDDEDDPADGDAEKARKKAERDAAKKRRAAEKQAREAEARRAAFAAATETRIAFGTDLLNGRPNRNDVIGYIVADYLGGGFGDDVPDRLGITPGEGQDQDDAFYEFASASLANALRAALAVAFDYAESLIAQAGDRAYDNPNVRRFYAFLTANGYEPTEVEAAALDANDPDKEQNAA